jgi:SPP1 family predicted phage head-tail adaptor
MRAGSRRHLLVIEQSVPTIDSVGGRVDAWVEYCQVHGSLSPLSGREFFAAQQYETEVKAKSWILYFPGITNDMRIRHDGLIYNIIFVQNIDLKNRDICLMLSEGLRD